MDKQQTSTTPRCTGSTPNFTQAGSSTGDKIMIAGPVSITIPNRKNMITSTVSTEKAEWKLPKMKVSTALVALVKESTRPKAVAKASTNAKPP